MTKIILTIKNDSIPIKFIVVAIIFNLNEMRESIEWIFMKTYDETIKIVKADNKKVDDIVQGINEEASKLQ